MLYRGSVIGPPLKVDLVVAGLVVVVDLIRFGGRVAYVDLVSSSFVEESLQVVGGGRMSMCRSPVAAADRPAVI